MVEEYASFLDEEVICELVFEVVKVFFIPPLA